MLITEPQEPTYVPDDNPYTPTQRRQKASSIIAKYPQLQQKDRDDILNHVGTVIPREELHRRIDALPIDKKAKYDLWATWWAPQSDKPDVPIIPAQGADVGPGQVITGALTQVPGVVKDEAKAVTGALGTTKAYQEAKAKENAQSAKPYRALPAPPPETPPVILNSRQKQRLQQAPPKGKVPGMVEEGNIKDLYNRPVLNNPDGSYSTTSSMSFSEGGPEILIPTVVDGKRLTEDQAIAHYHETGEHLGKFDTPEHADAYANGLHESQALKIDGAPSLKIKGPDKSKIPTLPSAIRAALPPTAKSEGSARELEPFITQSRADLDKARGTLDVNDKTAVDAFNKQLAEHNALVDNYERLYGKKAFPASMAPTPGEAPEDFATRMRSQEKVAYRNLGLGKGVEARSPVSEAARQLVSRSATAGAAAVSGLTFGVVDPMAGEIRLPEWTYTLAGQKPEAVDRKWKGIGEALAEKGIQVPQDTWQSVADTASGFLAQGETWGALSRGLEPIFGTATATGTTGILRRIEQTIGTGALWGAIEPNDPGTTGKSRGEAIADSVAVATIIHGVFEGVDVAKKFRLLNKLKGELGEFLYNRAPGKFESPEAASKFADQVVDENVAAAGGPLEVDTARVQYARQRAGQLPQLPEFPTEGQGPQGALGTAPPTPGAPPAAPVAPVEPAAPIAPQPVTGPQIPPNLIGISGNHGVYADGTTVQLNPVQIRLLRNNYKVKEFSGADILALQKATAPGLPPTPAEPVSQEIAQTLEQPPAAVTVQGGQIQDTLPMEPGAAQMGGDSTIAGELPQVPAGVPPTNNNVTPASSDPTSPPGPRWQGDRGAMPGEPAYFLDGETEEDAKAAIIENEVEGGGFTYTAWLNDGRSFGPYGEISLAAQAAEAAVDGAPPKPLGTAEEPQVIKSDEGTKTLGPRWTIGEHDLSDFGEDWMPVAYLDGQNPEDANAAITQKGDQFMVETRDGPSFGPFDSQEMAAAAAEQAVPQKKAEAPPAPLGQPKLPEAKPQIPVKAEEKPPAPVQGRYSVRPRADGKFEVLKPNGQPVRMAPFAEQAAAEAEAAKQQAKFEEMTGVQTPAPAAEKPPAPLGQPEKPPSTSLHQPIIKDVYSPEAPPVTPVEKPVTVTDNSVRDHPQQVKISGTTITVNSKVGRQKAGTKDIPMGEWLATDRRPTANPAYNKHELLKKYFGDLDEQAGGPDQAQRIRDSIGRAIDKALHQHDFNKPSNNHPVPIEMPEETAPATPELTPGQQLVQGGRGAKLPESPPETPAAKLTVGQRVTAQEGTGTVHAISGSDIKLRMDDGTISKWIPARRVTAAELPAAPVEEGDEGEPDEEDQRILDELPAPTPEEQAKLDELNSPGDYGEPPVRTNESREIQPTDDFAFTRKVDLFPHPKERVNYSSGLKKTELLTPEQAKARIEEWKAEAARIGREEDHSNDVIFSLFDRTGEWSKPYRDAGYDVRTYDIENGDDLLEFFPVADIIEAREAGKRIVGVLSAPPCTSFAVSGARWWEDQHDKKSQAMVEKKYGFAASRYFNTPLDYANTLVKTVELFVETANPEFYVMENPVGRIAEQNQLPDATLVFDPNNFGDPYTKKTLMWGEFNPNLPTANIEPTEGSKIHDLRGDDPLQKLERSITPEGFSYAFFMANHGKTASKGEAVPEPLGKGIKPKFKYEVQTDDTGKWSGNAKTYDTEQEALDAGHNLMDRWMAVRDVRVVPVEEPAGLPETPKEEPKAEAKPAEPEFKLTAPPDYADKTPKEREFFKSIDAILADPKWSEAEKLGAKNYRDEIVEGLKAAEEAGEDFDPEYLNTDIGDKVTEAYEKVYRPELVEAEAKEAEKEAAPKTPISTLAFRVRDAIKAGQSIDNPLLTKWAVEAFGGTRGEGKYDPKMAYDAAEAGINMAIREPGVVDFKDVPGTLKRLRALVEKMPTQADRTDEQSQLQQFSTPPEEAFAATLAAAIHPGMVVLEPSAGNGGIAIMAEAAGAKVITNELSGRRKQILESLGFPAHSVDAEHLNALLPPGIRPDIIVMNPPFSSTAKGRSNNTAHGGNHVLQALLRLKDGGRLVAIVGRGMAHGRPGFAEWWDKLEKKYNVRANVGIDGKYYRKYGTGFDNQIIVIDKTGPTPGNTRAERLGNIVRAEALSPEQAIELLEPLSKEDIRERLEPTSGRPSEPVVRNPGSRGRKPAPAPDIKGAPRGEREHPAAGEQSNPESAGMGQLDATPGQQPGTPPIDGGQTGGGRLPAPGEPKAHTGLGGEPGLAGAGQPERVGGGRPGLTPTPPKSNTEAIDSVLNGPVGKDAIQDLKSGLKSGPRKKITNASRAIPKTKGVQTHAMSAPPSLPTPPPEEYGSESITDLEPDDQLNLLQFGAAQFKATQDYDTWIAKMKSELGQEWAPYLPTAFDLIESVAEAKGFKPEEKPKEEEAPQPEEEGVFSRYVVRKAKFDNSVPHPADMVESATMSSVEPPDVTYKPSLPEEVIKEGRLSDVQLEAITYAGQRHQTKLPSGQTAGFWIGDGTGVGKGRTASGIILDNLLKGKKRALWLSVGQQLAVDAKRDLEGVGVPLPLLQQQDTKMADAIPNKNGVLFSTYGMAAANWKQNTKERFHQIVDWLGPGFDGVIIMDEGHKMKGAMGTTVGGAVTTKTGTDSGAMGLALSKEFPNAKIVYVSATGATIARNMAYMDRLGLWGPGAPFQNFMGFLSAMDAGGVGAMEMLARDLKATGSYISRTLSFKGVDYDTVVHTLTPEEIEQYKGMADFWADMSDQFEQAMENANQPKSTGRQMSQFYSTQQRFFLQVMTSLQLPEMFKHAENDLKEGRSIIISLINTNEGQVKRKVQEALASGEDLSDIDFTPREVMFDLIEKYFPVQEYETVHNDATGQDEQVVMKDEHGNPVLNPENVAMKEALLEKLHAMSVPDNPIDAIVAHFGPKNVSEISGRKKRLEEGKYVGRKIEGVKIKDRDEAEIKRFQDGITRVAIITSKGSTGISLHSDKGAKNKQRRVMYAMQLSWSADQQMQTTPGRAHRAFQESAPVLKLFRTNLKGQERLVNTVSSRLASLGAISKGGRETLGGGIFGVHDLTDKYGSAALVRTYGMLISGRIPGIDNGTSILKRMGMLNTDGGINNSNVDDVDRFLNRIMSLPVDEQNAVFEAFYEEYQKAVEAAKEKGEFDVGVHKIEGDNFRTIGEPETVYTHPESGAKTQLVHLEGEMPLHPFSYKDIAVSWRSEYGFYINNRSGKLYAARARQSDSGPNNRWNILLTAPTGKVHTVQATSLHDDFRQNFTEVSGQQLEKRWTEEFKKAPQSETAAVHILTGAIYPIYNRVMGGDNNIGTKIGRATLKNGKSFVGLQVEPNEISGLKARLGIGTALGGASGQQIFDLVRGGSIIKLDNGWRIKGSKVHGESRIEVVAATGTPNREEMKKHGTIEEIIDHKIRYFVPTSEDGPQVIDSILKLHAAINDETVRSTPPPAPPSGPQGGSSAMKTAPKEGPPSPLGKKNNSKLVGGKTLPPAPKTKLESAAEDAHKVLDMIKGALAPAKGGLAAELTEPILRELHARRDAEDRRLEHSMGEAYDYFEKKTKEHGYEWITGIERDKISELPESERAFAHKVRALQDWLWHEVQKRNGMERAIETLFPRYWKNPNAATTTLGRIFGRRPLQGTKAHEKMRKFEWFTEGLDAGLEPLYPNPIDTFLAKATDLWKYITAHDAIEKLERAGVLRTISVFAPKRKYEGMAEIKDPIGTVYGPPTVAIREAFDEHLFNALNDFAKDIGISNYRKVKIGREAGVGGDTWGVAKTGGEEGDKIWTKAGGPETVITHEIGHVLDHRYGLQARLDPYNDELDKLAEQRHRDKIVPKEFMEYVKEPSERIANLIHAMVHTPELAEEIAPKATAEMTQFLNEHSELRPLLDIVPSLVMGSREYEMRLGGMLVVGKRLAPEAAAKMINNFLSQGLSKHKLYRGLKAVSNSMNNLNLGLSGFHYTTTAINAAASMVAMGIQQLVKGQWKDGVTNLISGEMVVIAPIKYLAQGLKMRRELYMPGSQEEKYAKQIEQFIAGGGHFGRDTSFDSGALKKFWDAWNHGRKGPMALRAIPAFIEWTGRPLMKHWVPLIKMGVFGELAQQSLSELPATATQLDKLKAMARAVDNVDQRFGQVVKDNYFWHRTLHDILSIIFRSPMWNLGTAETALGGTIQASKALLGRGEAWHQGEWTGKKGKDDAYSFKRSFKGVPPQTAFLMGLTAVTMLIGAVAMYLKTGKTPKEPKDYFFFQDGGVNPDGTPSRSSPPTYIGNLYSFGHDLPSSGFRSLGNKSNPLASIGVDFIRNEDYSGTEIYHPDDPHYGFIPGPQQIQDMAKRIAQGWEPFAITNAVEKIKTGNAPLGSVAESYFGFTPAPKSLDETPAERLAAKYMEKHMPAGSRTKQQFDRAQTRSQITRELNSKDPSQGVKTLQEAWKAGKLSESDVDLIQENTGKAVKGLGLVGLKQGKLPPDAHPKEPLEKMLKSADLEEILNVFDIANQQEKALLSPMIQSRVFSKALLPEQRSDLMKRAIKAANYRQGLPRTPGLPAPPPN